MIIKGGGRRRRASIIIIIIIIIIIATSGIRSLHDPQQFIAAFLLQALPLDRILVINQNLIPDISAQHAQRDVRNPFLCEELWLLANPFFLKVTIKRKRRAEIKRES
jgi:hypothetical protein